MRDGYYGADGLRWQMHEIDRENIWREYMATMCHAIGRLNAKEWKFPSYISMVHPNIAKKDSRTGREILEGLKKRLESG